MQKIESKMAIIISVVVPVKKINKNILEELIPALKKQSFKDFELIIVPDKYKQKIKFPSFVRILPSWPKTGPADKRDFGVTKSGGEIIAFIDDDAYPDKDWLKSAYQYFNKKKIAAVCGPGLTPENDNLKQRVSGWVWRSWLGAGGAGIYRSWMATKRSLDDYPSFNLIVRKSDFLKIGGFSSHFWPGEDTKLCHDLVYGIGKTIMYDPKILVYHHRREVFGPHLLQISRFAIHRGHFARILPKTSFKFDYFLPSIFTLALTLGPILALLLYLNSFVWPFLVVINLYRLLILFYVFSLLTVSAQAWFEEKNFKLCLLLMPAIASTHLVYGALFIKGFFTKKLKR